MPTPFDPREVLEKPLMANLATLAEDGSPRNSPVWYHWEDDALWMLGDAGASSVRRIVRDPRVAVEIVDYDNSLGILRHLGLRGRAQVVSMDPALFRRLLTRYLGPETTWNPWFIETVARPDDLNGRLIRLAPQSTFTNDASFFRTGPKLARPTRNGHSA
ncbi:pyridoxamine 5'-phosphate oxidase family protein [Lutimaribacter sp. EGI FJ00015]|uniref:Pyridoxamine 5'-phosphate oxidase family protein n=1 Tax=Lutimaribacter degradans TaxID=2945989 RepID=A0ACC5ZXX4_9RHOB|nr:pyridoxamine 5'-phosphate oxidase family protein [Lutimaribacter sp. EGI FJ00013]MCM2562611.1 pyridoxamine 5'-phosphate oxidase family protein [Lutimaribacter sp. EGI FJ00013]MCO0613768.1 pyridoxamine 5'-phosphate oxidase family protein [Lutimaribacter sp. EGI FJ00015]MCO0636749.1 pyridoxamine 5'-phosphate oxidase family protein [Lutimaribacter sp. EGI FJ00014]